MKTAPTSKTAERAGRWVSRVWRGIARSEARAIHWLAAQGIPGRLGPLLLLGLKIAIFVVLLYVVFWLALLLVFVIAGAWLMLNSDLDNEKQPELRDGHSGVGWYNKDDLRIDMDDPDDPH